MSKKEFVRLESPIDNRSSSGENVITPQSSGVPDSSTDEYSDDDADVIFEEEVDSGSHRRGGRSGASSRHDTSEGGREIAGAETPVPLESRSVSSRRRDGLSPFRLKAARILKGERKKQMTPFLRPRKFLPSSGATALIYVLAGGVLVASGVCLGHDVYMWPILLEAVVLLAIAFCSTFFEIRERFVKKRELEERGRRVVQNLSVGVGAAVDDIITLSFGDMAPCRLRCVETGFLDLILEEGEIFEPSGPSVLSPCPVPGADRHYKNFLEVQVAQRLEAAGLARPLSPTSGMEDQCLVRLSVGPSAHGSRSASRAASPHSRARAVRKPDTSHRRGSRSRSEQRKGEPAARDVEGDPDGEKQVGRDRKDRTRRRAVSESSVSSSGSSSSAHSHSECSSRTRSSSVSGSNRSVLVDGSSHRSSAAPPAVPSHVVEMTSMGSVSPASSAAAATSAVSMSNATATAMLNRGRTRTLLHVLTRSRGESRNRPGVASVAATGRFSPTPERRGEMSGDRDGAQTPSTTGRRTPRGGGVVQVGDAWSSGGGGEAGPYERLLWGSSSAPAARQLGNGMMTIDTERSDSVSIKPFQSYRFVILRSTTPSRLNKLVRSAILTYTPFERFWQRRRNRLRWLLLIMFIVALLIGTIRFAASGSPRAWPRIVLLRAVDVLLPGAALFWPLIPFVLRCVGTWAIIDVFEEQQRVEQRGESRDEADRKFEDIKGSGIRKSLSTLFGILFGGRTFFTRSSKLALLLGNITVLCVPDENVLLSPLKLVQAVCLLRADDDPIVLTLSRHPVARNELLWDDESGWKTYLPSLKAIGLNCLFNSSQCGFEDGDEDRTCSRTEESAIDDVLRHLALSASHEDCLCPLATAIGFSSALRQTFSVAKRIYVICGERYLKAVILTDSRSSQYQLLIRGDVRLVLSVSRQFFDGQALRPLSETDLMNICDMEEKWSRQGLTPQAFAYAPLDLADNSELSFWISSLMEESEAVEFVTGGEFCPLLVGSPGSIFCGICGVRAEPKPEITEVVESLRKAGVRFVFMSEKSDRQARVIASAMGLETDWNSCIHLRDVKDVHVFDGVGEAEESDIKARLPRGIPAIRTHIEEVDNVPLLVQLFCFSTPHTVREMIEVYQENGEVVCCLASSNAPLNIGAFLQSDLSLALERPDRRCARDGVPGFVECRKKEVSFPAALVFAGWTNLMAILPLIRKGREVVHNLRLAFSFMFFAHALLGLVVLMGMVLLQPAILTGPQLLCFVVFHVPIICLSLVSLPVGHNVMRTMPERSGGLQLSTSAEFGIPSLKERVVLHLAHGRERVHTWLRQSGVSTVRAVGGTLVVFSLFVCLLSALSAQWPWVLFGSRGFDESRVKPDAVNLVFAQNVAMWALLLLLFLFASTSLHPRRGLWNYHPIGRHSRLLPSLLLCIFAQCLYSLISTLLVCLVTQANVGVMSVVTPGPYSSLLWVLVPILFCFPVWSCCWDNYWKRKRSKRFDKRQKRGKLEFDTKLGMYSPV